MAFDPTVFSQRLLAWFDQHGRHDLPWQQKRTPYRVWVSEIMLQQTQVTTVIPYYQRFIQRFPTIQALAEAPLDEVLALWSGLGYYARARYLHQTARHVCAQYGGELPADRTYLQRLPGIGRSTAGAILALAYQQRQPILDGNVKRILVRVHGLDGWPGTTALQTQLWNLSERYTPAARVADYTQAIMDLGATICTPLPRCEHCPLQSLCRAYAEQRQTQLPTPKPRRKLPIKQTQMLLLQCNRQVLLERRPPTGIWGGLWSLPECPAEADVRIWCRAHLGLEVAHYQAWSPIRHTFSHFHLDITPIQAPIAAVTPCVLEGDRWVWYNTTHPAPGGFAAPVQRLINLLNDLTATSKAE